MSTRSQPATVSGSETNRATVPRRGRRPCLSRAQIAQAALEIVDRDGLGAMTMARVASALGVGTMTLYSYFRGKDELLDAVIDASVAEVEPIRLEGTWRQQLRQLAELAWRTLTRHPALARIRLEKPIMRTAALGFSEAAMGILLDTGFDAAEAAQIFRLLFTYTVGFASLSPAEATDEDRRAAAAALMLLPPDRFPNLTGAVPEASRAMGGEEQFAYGLERLLDGLEARLSAKQTSALSREPPPARRRTNKD
jgi:AcrR family transcriptional regulator